MLEGKKESTTERGIKPPRSDWKMLMSCVRSVSLWNPNRTKNQNQSTLSMSSSPITHIEETFCTGERTKHQTDRHGCGIVGNADDTNSDGFAATCWMQCNKTMHFQNWLIIIQIKSLTNVFVFLSWFLTQVQVHRCSHMDGWCPVHSQDAEGRPGG